LTLGARGPHPRNSALTAKPLPGRQTPNGPAGLFLGILVRLIHTNNPEEGASMKARIFSMVAATILSLATISAIADDSRSYTEDTVSTVNSIRTKPGMRDAYMKWLDTSWKALMEDQKKAGIIVDYSVYEVTPRTPQDPNLYLVVTYKNMAALDGLEDRTEPMMKKIFASRDQANKAAAERESLRETIGSQLIRHLVLK
jgi:hypothetical protein